MLSRFTNSQMLVILIIFDLLLILITEPALKWLHKGLFNPMEDYLLEPIFYLSLGMITSCIILLFVKKVFFQKWLKNILSWFLPISLVIIFSTDVYGGIPQPGRTDTAWYFSFLLVLITVIFILFQRLYFKVK